MNRVPKAPQKFVQPLLVAMLAWVLATGASAAKPPTPQPTPQDVALTAPLTLDAKAIAQRQELLAAATDLPAPVRDWTSSTLASALAALREADALTPQLAAFQNQVKTATSQTLQLQERLQALSSAGAPEVPTTATSAYLSQLISQAQADVSQREKELADIRAERLQRQQRQASLPQAIVETRQQLEKIDRGEAVPPPPDAGGWEIVRDVAHKAIRASAEKRLAVLEAERDAMEATRGLIDLREQVAQQLLAQATARLNALQEALTAARQREAQDAVQQAQRALWDAANAHPAIRAIAADNEELARRRAGAEGTPAKIAAVTTEFQKLRQMRQRIQNSYETVKKRLELLGGTTVLGQIMRKERNELPSTSELARALNQYLAQMAQVQADLLDIREKQSDMPALEAQLRSVLQQQVRLTSEDTSAVVNSLLTQRRDLLNALAADLDELFSKLAELTTAYTLVLQETRDYAQFLDEHILWVRSAKPFASADFRRALSACFTLLSRENLSHVADALKRDALEQPAIYLSALVLLVVLVVWKRRAPWPLDDAAALTSSREALRAATTLLVRFVTPWPFVLGLLGMRIGLASTGGGLLEGVGWGLVASAGVVLLTNVVRELILLPPVSSHLARPLTVRKFVLVAGIVGAVGLFVVTVAHEFLPTLAADSLERTVFIVTMILFAGMAYGAIRAARVLEAPEHSIVALFASARANLTLAGTAALVLLFLGTLSALGFHYSARHIFGRLIQSVIILSAAWGLWELLNSWIERLASEAGTRLHAAKSHAAVGRVFNRAAAALSAAATGAQYVHQVRRMMSVIILLTVAALLWVAWRDMLPALALFTRIPLWQHGEVVAGAPVTFVTLGDLILAVVYLVVTIIFVRNVPGLVELSFLSHSHIDPGTRYAIAALIRYTLVMVGMIEVARELGLTWESVQWMAAAVTVGLGFGLQEIFANFISGLILLFERPVRVGDWITVSGTTGLVTHIRTRATTIRDPDGKELLVPNKLLITGAVMNWTLSARGTRLVFDVRTDLTCNESAVRALLLEVAKAEPLVARRPPPFVLLDAVTNTDQRFRLFVYTNAVEDHVELKDNIMRNIREKFAADGINLVSLECPLW
jgi:potassium efflux system protein